MTVSANALVGAWTFVDWTITTNGRVTRPFQPNPTGYITYTATNAAGGIMTAVIQAGGRARFPSEDIRKRPDVEKAAAFDGYFHYAGPWRVVGDTVIHTVTVALNPNMLGTEQVRHVQFKDDLLILSAEESLENGKGTRRHALSWRRV